MGKILVLYASTTGNTELMADAIANYLLSNQHDVTIKTFDFDPIYIEELADYDAILIGTHTWDDGDLPYEIEDFYDELENVNIKNKVFAVFGSADSFYDTYGGAIDLLGDRIEKLGGSLFEERLKVDLAPNDHDLSSCKQFAEKVSLMTELLETGT